MLAIVIASTLAAASDPAPIAEAALAKQPVRECRIVSEGYSRSSDITICRTKAQWRKRDLCREPTRYCSPEQKAAMYGRATPFSLSEGSRIVCRVVSATGSRLSSEQVCLPQREWQRMFDESSNTVADLLNYSKIRHEGDR